MHDNGQDTQIRRFQLTSRRTDRFLGSTAWTVVAVAAGWSHNLTLVGAASAVALVGFARACFFGDE